MQHKMLLLLAFLAAFCLSCNDRSRSADTRPDVRSTSEAVAVVSGVPVTTQQLDKEVGARAAAMQAQLYRLRRSVLDSMIGRMLVEAEASRRGLAIDEVTRIEVAKRTTPVAPEEARAVYEAAMDRFSGTSETEALASITASMGQTRIQSARMQWVADPRKASNVSVMLEPPRVEVGAGKNPIRGTADALVSIVVFTDYECPFCSRHLSTLKRLEQHYGQSVSIAVRDFPLPIHKRAVKAAEAAAWARDQGRYWENSVQSAGRNGLNLLYMARQAHEVRSAMTERHVRPSEIDKTVLNRYATILAVCAGLLLPVAPAGAAERKAQPPVEITLKDHNRLLRARLISLAEHEVEIERNGRREVLRLDDVVKIDKARDSLANGAVIGALVLGGWCALVCGQGLDGDSSVGGVVLANAAFGAALGAGIDALRHDQSRLYPLRGDGPLAPPRGKVLSVAFRVAF